jgi:protein TonB
VPASWQSRLFAHLGRYKRYPAEAMQRRQEGTPLVRIVIDRAGRVLSVRLEQGSGHKLLDDEAQAMVERAQPLPPLPDDVTSSTIEVVVPLNFRVR